MKCIFAAAVLLLSANVLAKEEIIEYRYVGLTTAEFTGSDAGGVGGMNAACAAEYGAGARLATSSEAEARLFNASDMREGWVLPTPPIVAVPDPSGGFEAFDALGRQAGGFAQPNEELALVTAACGRFQIGTEDEQGMSVGPNGLLKVDDCDERQSAACSAPVVVPAREL